MVSLFYSRWNWTNDSKGVLRKAYDALYVKSEGMFLVNDEDDDIIILYHLNH